MPTPQLSRATWISFWLGVWGMGTGFGLFLLLWHERHHPLTFLVALGFAAIASFIVESTRALIEGHDHQGKTGPRAPRIVVSILTLAVIELFVVAVHTAVNLPHETLASVGEAVLGAVASRRLPPAVSLTAVAVMWMALGGLLAAGLMHILPGLHGKIGERVAWGAARGALVGFVLAPLALLLAVVTARALASGWLFVADHDAWERHVDWVANQGWLASVLMVPVRFLGKVWDWGWVGKVLFVGLLVGTCASVFDKRERTPLIAFVFVGLCALIAVPLFSELGGLLVLLGLAAIVWGIPGTAIGALAPTLAAPAAHPALWGLVAFGGATLLAVVTLTRLGPAWLLVPAALLGLAGVLLRRKEGPQAFWPLLALCGGMLVAGSTWLRQEATAQGVFERFHALSDVVLPERRPEGMLVPDGFGGLWPGVGLPVGWDRPIGGGLSGLDGPVFEESVTDARLAAAVEALPADDSGRKDHRAWLELRAKSSTAASHLEALEALVANYPRAEHVRAGSRAAQLVLAERLDPQREFRRLFSLRLAAERSAAAETVAIELDLGPAPERLPPSASAALLARLDKGLASWQDPISLAHARALRERLGTAVMVVETAQLVGFEEAARAYLSAAEETHTLAPEPLATQLRGALEAWGESPRRQRAEHLLHSVRSAHEAARTHERRAASRLLELCLTGSLGFWTCVGLLAGGAVLRRRTDG